jgi:D-glycero-D-manno-heptose 1,7-bisphosphate phosphatase
VSRLSQPAIFLDRDGTLNVRPPEHCYVRAVEEFVLLEGAMEGAALLAQSGYTLAVVSNQRGIARGLVDPAVLGEIEEIVQRELAAFGCHVTAFRYCRHDENDGCSCRKPAPGMLIELARELDLDLSRSWMIGDSENDVAAGRAAGCRTVRIGDGGSTVSSADLVVPSLFAAAERVVELSREAA